MTAPDENGWMPIDKNTPKGELLLFEPEMGRMPARVVIEIYPTYYPRKATHWQYVPKPPVSP